MAAVQTVLQHDALTSIGEQHTTGAACSGFVPPPHNQSAVVYDDVPAVAHASQQKFLKSEDVVFVRGVVPVLGDVHSVFMVCDGHMGVGAASHCVTHMPGLLSQLLPQHLPDWSNNSEVESYAEKVRQAISTAAVLLDNDWARLDGTAGTTLTMAVLSGWLLTVANTGDSNAVIDCGDDVQEITFSHRIQVNKAEQARLRKAGAQLAPVGFHLQGPAKPQEMGVGPLRMWPGGLCVSRSIGDLDAGPLIVPLPHIRQVVVNRSRALRIIMASDGLWDLMSFSKAAKSVRHKLPEAAVDALIQMAVRDKRMSDDVSIIIADVLPPPTPGATPPQFPAAALKAGSPGGGSSGSSSRSSGGGLFGCFKPSRVEDEPDITPPQPSQPSPQPHRLSLNLQAGLARLSGRAGGGLQRPGPPAKPWLGLQWFADVDCFEAYPMQVNQLKRTEAILQRPKTPPKRGDFTVHGGQQAHRFHQDSSWHTGNSHHGPSSSGNSRHGPAGDTPLLLSAEQLQALAADGPAAAASMHFTGNNVGGGGGGSNGGGGGLYGSSSTGFAEGLERLQQQQMAGAAAAANGMARGASAPVPAAAAAAAGSGGGGGGEGFGAVPMIMVHNRSFIVADGDAPAAAAARPLGEGSNRGMPHASRSQTSIVGVPPASPSPTALARSASAEFELDGSGVYAAPEAGVQGHLGAPGRVVPLLPESAGAAAASRFGSSAPEAIARDVEGRVHSGRGALAAAAAADDERTLRQGYGI